MPRPPANATIRTRVQMELQLERGATAFEVLCIRPGKANGLLYSEEVLERSLPLWSGVTSFVDHANGSANRSIDDVCGVISDPNWTSGRGIVATLRLAGQRGEGIAPLLHSIVQNAARGADTPAVGVSADMLIAHQGGNVTRIEKVLSVDVVVNPACGQVVRALNSQHDPADDDPPAEQPAEPPAPAIPPDLAAELDEVRQTRRELTHAYLDTLLASSHLPPPMQEAVQTRLALQRDFTMADALREVEAERATWARLQEAATVQNLGAPAAARDMYTELDRLQLAADRLLGIPADGADAPRLSGIKELYLLLTGDHDLHGVFHADRVTLANITTSTFSDVVKNALNKVLVKSFELRPQWWKPIVYEEDFPTLNDVTWITLGGFADLATVAEGNAYAEIANLTDASEVTPFVKKGNYIGITLEAIDRDNVAAIRQIPRSLGLAAYRTLSTSVSTLFTASSGVGPYWPSSQAVYHLFDNEYNNLGASALSADDWDITIQAMFKQTQPGSSKRIGVRPKWLIVPIELEKTALTILNSLQEPGVALNDANVRAGQFGVVTVPEFTDATDWAAAADPNDMPGICIGYRFGRTPELFVADEQTAGAMFTNDELRIKVRFLYAVGVADPKALYKHNVA